MYVEARLGDLLVQRLSPVSVDPATGDFSYEGATQNFAVFNVSGSRVISITMVYMVCRLTAHMPGRNVRCRKGDD